MKIGIDASRAFLSKRTGIEEYSYQVIKHLRDELPRDAEVVLYVRKKLRWHLPFRHQKKALGTELRPSIPRKLFWLETPPIDFDVPTNWTVRGIWAPRFWTQMGLSMEMLWHTPGVLFVPAHTVPLIHPKRTVVTIHGLEYEFSPESYSWYERWYMRFFIQRSVKWASRVIAVSENTRRDLVQLYGVPAEKITVIYEGIGEKIDDRRSTLEADFQKCAQSSDLYRQPSTYFLFIGRVEERKNVRRIIEAFEYFKHKTGLPHQLVLAGKPGYGYEKIKDQISNSQYRDQIHELGYVTEAEKWQLLEKAAVFVFPSLYEGFGLPVIEAQMAKVPVVTSKTSSLPEIAGDGAILVDPTRPKEIGRALVTLATDSIRLADIIDNGSKNVGRFSWKQCARRVAELLLESKL